MYSVLTAKCLVFLIMLPGLCALFWEREHGDRRLDRRTYLNLPNLLKGKGKLEIMHKAVLINSVSPILLRKNEYQNTLGEKLRLIGSETNSFKRAFIFNSEFNICFNLYFLFFEISESGSRHSKHLQQEQAQYISTVKRGKNCI